MANSASITLMAIDDDPESLKPIFQHMVGRSPRMLEVFARIRRVGPHFRNALITGSTGTGKELVARALHMLSPVALGRFVICNCSALVETLFESELFGHVKGAFTGATQDRVGLFEYANGGCVFLDEIGDMPLVTQSKLLRVLQNQEVQRVGSPVVRKVDVRVIAATNRDLRRQILEKQFREDLFYRLSMIEIRVPDLAERKEDLPLLERHFLERFSNEYGKSVRNISQRAQSVLRRHSWPGNVRELENVIGNACMMTEGDTIDVRNFPDYLQRSESRPGIDSGKTLLRLEEMERRYIARVLDQMGRNKAQTARILGISRAKLYDVLRESTASGNGE
jgi:DNA-binding NtrC family response regulator